MGLTVHFEVLNQLGTPMLYSDTLALRPAAGIKGRIFYRTDSPFGIYRDNGVTWDLISSVGSSGAVTGSGVATRVAYWDTTSSISSDANLYFDATNDRLGIGTSTPSSALEVLGTITDTNTVTGITGLVTTETPNSSFSNNFTFNSGISTVASLNVITLVADNSLNYSGANTINSTSYNAAELLRNNITFGAAAASITYTQATGIRALSNQQSIYQQSGANSGTISHYANLQIFGDQKLGAGLTTFTNRYQVLINDLAEFTAGFTYTNRWGIYQAGASNNNYFAGKIITGSTTVSTFQLDVTGTSRVSGAATFSGNVTVVSQLTTNFIRPSTNGTELVIFTAYNTTYGVSFWQSSNDPDAFTSGTRSLIRAGITFNPTSGTAVRNQLLIDPIINQTGGANGISRGLFLNPTITAAADWRGIEITTGGVYVNTSSVSASAILQADSTTKGFLPPRMTLTQRNAIVTPTSGLLTINTTDATLDGYDGTAAAWYQSVRSDNGYVKVNATTSGTSGGSSGQHLQINVNGTNYKIALLNV